MLDSGFHAEDHRIPVTGSLSLSVELGFRILIVSWIPDSKAPDSGIQKEKGKSSPLSGTRIPFHGAKL